MKGQEGSQSVVGKCEVIHLDRKSRKTESSKLINIDRQRDLDCQSTNAKIKYACSVSNQEHNLFAALMEERSPWLRFCFAFDNIYGSTVWNIGLHSSGMTYLPWSQCSIVSLDSWDEGICPIKRDRVKLA